MTVRSTTLGPVTWDEKTITVWPYAGLSVKEKNRVNKIAREWELGFEVNIHAGQWLVYVRGEILRMVDGKITIPMSKLIYTKGA